MAKKDDKWMEKAFAGARGQLRKATGTKKGDKIPVSKLKKAEKSKDEKTRKRAQLADTARKINSKRKK